MKNIARIFLVAIINFKFLIASSFAQAPQAIPYQAVARDVGSNLIVNQTISLRFTIHDLIPAGVISYQETHTVVTNALGLFSVNIGEGIIVSGVFDDVNWQSGNEFLQVEIDVTGGSTYTNMGTQQMLSVPYALFSETSGNGLPPGNAVGNTLRWNGTSWVDDAALFNDGINIGISTITPGAKLDVNGDALVNGVTVGRGAGNISFNTTLGYNALSLATGNYNTATGYEALKNTGSGHSNTAYGFVALQHNTSGSVNTALGNAALRENLTGDANTAVGISALENNTEGGSNTAIGDFTLFFNTSGDNNSALGAQALRFNQTGNNNIAIGRNSLYTNYAGSNNIGIGNSADVGGTNLTNAIAIGYNSRVDASNSMVLGGIGVDAVKVGIGLRTPIATLDVAGNIKIADGTQGLGKVLISDADGLASWSTPSAPVETDPQVSSTIINQVPKWDGTTLVDGIITDDGTKIGIGTNTPEFKLSLNADGGIIAKGTFGSGNTLTTIGSGSRMIWYPKKGAFRVGTVASPYWDDVNIGDYSFACGYETKANEIYSFASGGYSIAQGEYGISMGYACNAAGSHSVAIGNVNFAEGNYSTSLGSGTHASGTSSTAMGVETVASGNYSTAMGNYTSTNNHVGAFIVGDYSTTLMNSTADNSFASRFAGGYSFYSDVALSQPNAMFLTGGNVGIGTSSPSAKLDVVADALVNGITIGRGNGNIISNTAVGKQALLNNVSGVGNTAIGLNALESNNTGATNTATGNSALRNNNDGEGNTATGSGALFTNGKGNNNSAFGSFALFQNLAGDNNIAMGYHSLYNNTAGDNNIAIGNNADVLSGNLFNATAIGYNARVDASNSMVLGGTGQQAVHVGIGVSAPAATLDVVGNVKITDGTEGPGKILVSDATGFASWGTENDPEVGPLTKYYVPHWNNFMLVDGIITDNGTFVGIDEPLPEFKLSLSNDGGIISHGTVNSGATLTTNGSGTRMFWYPKKAAFRTGGVNNTDWDDSKIGLYSFASGFNAKGSGDYSTSMGLNTIADGDYSTTIGYNSSSSGSFSHAYGSHVSDDSHIGVFILGDFSTMTTTLALKDNSYTARFNGGYTLYSSNTLASGVTLATGAGSWTSISDKNKKENFSNINSEEILQKVCAMKITGWNYKSQPESQRHIGCMSQDFYAAFHLDGESDTTINSLDIDGINMAAIQALKIRTDELKIATDKIEALNDALIKLSARVDALGRDVRRLE